MIATNLNLHSYLYSLDIILIILRKVIDLTNECEIILTIFMCVSLWLIKHTLYIRSLFV